MFFDRELLQDKNKVLLPQKPLDISNLMGLLVALGEIGSYLTNETMEMSKDNTFPMSVQKMQSA